MWKAKPKFFIVQVKGLENIINIQNFNEGKILNSTDSYFTMQQKSWLLAAVDNKNLYLFSGPWSCHHCWVLENFFHKAKKNTEIKSLLKERFKQYF